jgi:D-sedoheptulose 7-phosphate isomerase
MKEDAVLYGNQYIQLLVKELNSISTKRIAEISTVLRHAQQSKKRVYVFGNGGSAATASHLACDFGKNTYQPKQPRLKVISLVDSLAGLTAYANDKGYENVFSEQLLSLAEVGDIAIAISGSGNSPNVLKGIQTARQMGLKTIGLTGLEGGELEKMVDICLVVASDSMERIEDIHLVISHILTGLLRNASHYE